MSRNQAGDLWLTVQTRYYCTTVDTGPESKLYNLKSIVVRNVIAMTYNNKLGSNDWISLVTYFSQVCRWKSGSLDTEAYIHN